MAKNKLIAIDPNKVDQVITPDWTTSYNKKPFFQKALYTYTLNGETTKKNKHVHQYQVDKNGNGWAFETGDYTDRRIKHKHKIINWKILESQSECYPRCQDLLGEKGFPPHTHSFKGKKTLKFGDRYSITITTDYTSTGGDKLQARMNEQIAKGVSQILNYYSKIETSSILYGGYAEDWDLDPRPTSRLKVLVSLQSDICDNAPDLEPPSSRAPATKEIFLDTYNLKERLTGVESLLLEYDKRSHEFYGSTPGLDFVSESTKLSTFYPALVELLQANGFQFPQNQSRIITIGVDDKYRPLYSLYNDGKGFTDLYKRFNLFTNHAALRNDRTINFLINLNRIYQIYNNSEQVPMLEFCTDYVLKPPPYDFSRQSITKHLAINPRIDELEKMPGLMDAMSVDFTDVDWTPEYVKEAFAHFRNPENREALEKATDEAVDWVGDNIMGSAPEPKSWTLSGISKGMTDIENMYNRLLNKIPIQNLLLAALECLNWGGLADASNAWGKSKAFLNQANAFMGSSLPLFRLPSLFFPTDLPTVDYLGAVLKQLRSALISAVLNAALTMVLMIIEMLLDLCNECALGNVDADGQPLGYKRMTPATIMAAMEGGGAAQVATVGLMGQLDLGPSSESELAVDEASKRKVAAAISQESGTNPNKIQDGLGQETVDDINEFLFGWFQDSSKEKIEQQDPDGGTPITPGDEDPQATGPSPEKSKQEQAKEEMAKFLDVSFAATTPEEMANLLMGCQVGNQVEEVLTNAAKRYPTIKKAFSNNDNQEEVDPDRIKGAFKALGALVGPTRVLDTIKKIIEETPKDLRCLCDEDETALRQSLLEEKEDITQEQIDEQISKSKSRKEQKINDLLNTLNKDNPFEGLEPSIFCERTPDGGIKEGLMKGDPPTIVQMLDDTLDAIYDGISIGYNLEVDRFIPELMLDDYKYEIVPRTFRTKKPDGSYDGSREFNPRFQAIRQERNYAYGALAFGSLKPGYSGREDQEEYGSEPGKRGWSWDFNGWDGIPGDAFFEDGSKHGAGMMDDGQSIPTAKQEYLWEIANIDQEQKLARGTDVESMLYTPIGGRWVRNKDVDPKPDDGNGGIPPWEYTERFGYSPIPIVERKAAGRIFAPGLKQAYRDFCSGDDIFKITTAEDKYAIYEFDVPNKILEQAGINLEKMPTDIDMGAVSSPVALGSQAMKEAMSSVRGALESLGSSRIDISYIVPFFERSRALQLISARRDTYSLVVQTTPTVGTNTQSSYPIVLHEQVSTAPIITPIKKLFERDNLDISNEPGLHTPQEKYFVTFVEKSWTAGNRIWRDGREITKKPVYAQGFLPVDSTLEIQLKEVYYNQKAYDGIWEDLMCSIALQVAESPLLNPNGKVIGAINLHPMRETGKPNCDPHLLALDSIKKRIKDEYGLIHCLEQAYLSVGQDVKAEEKPFLRANFGGAAIATVRVYVLEIMLRSIFAFYYFRYDKVEDIDSTLIDYIATHMKEDITKKEFIREFTKALVDLYNRNVPEGDKTENFDFILKWFVRHQIWAVANTLSGIVGSTGKTDLDSILLQKWIPTYQIATSERGVNDELRFDKAAKSFEEQIALPTVSPQEIVALKTDLTHQMIAKMRASPGTRLDRWGDLYENPAGMIYREYFSVGNVPKNIWSLESPKSSENSPKYTKYSYGESLSTSKTGGSVPAMNREYHLFSNIKDAAGKDLNNKLTSGDNFDENALSFKTSVGDERIGVPPSERKALVMLTNLLSGMSSQDPHSTYSHGAAPWLAEQIRTHSNLETHGDSFSPGSFLKAWSRRNIGTTSSVLTFSKNSYFEDYVKNNPILRQRTGATNQKFSVVVPQGWWGQTDSVQLHNVWSPPPINKKGSYITSPVPNDGSENEEFKGDTYEGWGAEEGVQGSGHPGFVHHSQSRWFWIGGKKIGPWYLTRVEDDKFAWKLRSKTAFRVEFSSTLSDELKAVLNPTGKRGSGHLQQLNHITDLVERGDSPYISLLDFDLMSGGNILAWERRIWMAVRQNETNSTVKAWLAQLIGKYDTWIAEWAEMTGLFRAGEKERDELRVEIQDKMEKYPVATRPMLEPKIKDLTNGNIIQEVYIRIEDLDMTNAVYEGTEGDIRFANPDVVAKNRAFSSREGSEFFGEGYGDGIVNIEAFQSFMDAKFGANSFPSQTNPAVSKTIKVVGSEERGETITVGGDCGLLLKTNLISTPTPEVREDDDFRLRDFFGNISIGTRISYVLPVNDSDFTSDGTEELEILRDVQASQPNGDYIVESDKAYFVKEVREDGTQRNVKLIPLVCSEKTFDMNTKIADCINKTTIHKVARDGGMYAQAFGFFANFYRVNSYEVANSLRNTPEYKMLFKYLFPIDRMLSITNIYSSTYLSSVKNLGGIFDNTKEKLKSLFFIIENTGNPYANCTASNKDFADAIGNGLPWKGMGAMMLMIIAKTTLLIFKGFMEIADINIATSKKIIDIIHLANKAIAQAQMLANSAAQAGSAFADIFEDCEEQSREATLRILEDANDLYDWVLEIKQSREAHPIVTSDGKVNPQGWSQQKLLEETNVDTNKKSATMQLEKWINESFSDPKDIDPEITFSEMLELGPNGKIDIINKAKELNPDESTLKEIAEFNCSEEDCKPGNRPPSLPPKDVFDPIKENFIPEPKIWQIGMALLPFTLIPFSPTPFPLSLPFGPIYWIMDEKPMPDWLNSIPPADFLDKLFAADDPEAQDALAGTPPNPETCAADVGLPAPGTFDNDKPVPGTDEDDTYEYE